jgi:lipopolysaccharide biosynthesis glycosyltransferase
MNFYCNLLDLKSFIDNPILILGKGPSLTNEFYIQNKGKYTFVSVNENAIYFKSKICFFIDLEPFERAIDSLIEHSSIILIPYYFNIRVNDKKSLVCKIDSIKLIKEKFPQLLLKNKIFLFETGLGKIKHSNLIFKPNFVSTSSLLEILFSIGIKTLYGIGFDGGSNYSEILKQNHTTTLVNNFNNQFYIFRSIEIKYKKKFIIMNKEIINVYVGTTEKQMIATKVLEYSIKKQTSHNVNLIPLHIATKNLDLNVDIAGATPFSLQRIFIPKLNNNSGKAIYLDSDMLVFADIKNLLDCHEEGKVLCSCPAPPNSGRRDQYSVFTIDCSLAKWDIEDILIEAKKDYKSVMFDFSFEKNKVKNIDWRWNSLEFYDDSVKLIHFTDMDKQPWIDTRNKNKNIWLKWLILAVKDNFISNDEILDAVQKKWIRSGIINDLNNNSFSLFSSNDFFYLPPHTLERFKFFNKPILKNILAIVIKIKRLISDKHEK